MGPAELHTQEVPPPLKLELGAAVVEAAPARAEKRKENRRRVRPGQLRTAHGAVPAALQPGGDALAVEDMGT